MCSSEFPAGTGAESAYSIQVQVYTWYETKKRGIRYIIMYSYHSYIIILYNHARVVQFMYYWYVLYTGTCTIVFEDL